MYERPTHCPNRACSNHLLPGADFFRKRGYFTPKCRGHAQARYECKTCHKTFSNRTQAADAGQHRPDLNKTLAGLLCSGVTMRRAAELTRCAYNTVCARARWLAEQARQAHVKALEGDELKTAYILFDEMQTFEHASPKKLTIALAVRFKTRQILSVKVGKIPSDGHLAAYGRDKYGWTENEGPSTCLAALEQAALAAKPMVTVATDGDTSYAGLVATAMPTAALASAVATKSGLDPLFRLNHTCARIRADLACMARKTWTTTKRIARLQDRLDLFVAFHNGYKFC